MVHFLQNPSSQPLHPARYAVVYCKLKVCCYIVLLLYCMWNRVIFNHTIGRPEFIIESFCTFQHRHRQILQKILFGLQNRRKIWRKTILLFSRMIKYSPSVSCDINGVTGINTIAKPCSVKITTIASKFKDTCIKNTTSNWSIRIWKYSHFVY